MPHEYRAVPYRHPVPDAWPDLQARTQEILGGAEQPDADQAMALLHEVSELPNDILEANRYHAMGRIMQGMEARLEDTAIREEAVQTIGKSLAASYRVYSAHEPEAIHPEDITSRSGSLFRMAREAHADLPIEERLLADALITEQKLRMHPKIDVGVIYMPGDDQIKTPAADHVGRLSTDGAATVTKKAFMRRHQAMVAQGDMPEGPASVADILEHGGIEPLHLPQVGRRAATPRFDEFRHQIQNYIDTNDRGEVIFRADRMPSQRELPPIQNSETGEYSTLHEQRLRCPALFVDGLIENVMDIVPDALTNADERIGEFFRQE